MIHNLFFDNRLGARLKPPLSLALILSLFSCGGGGGGSEDGTHFVLLSIEIANASSQPLNSPIRMNFSEPVDLSSFALGSTISISSSCSNPEIVLPPATGRFYLDPSSAGKTVYFQGNCPLTPTLEDGGFLPSRPEGVMSYYFSVLDSTNNRGLIRNIEGKPLLTGSSIAFQTSLITNPFVDTVPGPPRLSEMANLPDEIGINLLSSPNAPIEIDLNQPVNPQLFREDWFYLRRVEDELILPSHCVLLENCNAENRSKIAVIPHGVLPWNSQIELVQSRLVHGLGQADFGVSDRVLKSIHIKDKETVQRDAMREDFEDQSQEDPAPPIATPLASWGNGVLQASFLAPPSEIDFAIGPGTANPGTVSFDTTLSFLKDQAGQDRVIENGIIQCRNFYMKRNEDSAGRLNVKGPNPLLIIATGEVRLDRGTLISAVGESAQDVTGIGNGHLPAIGGRGQAGGGDGGIGSPVAALSSPKGGNGKGPFNTPDAGGQGGHSGYGALTVDFTTTSNPAQCPPHVVGFTADGQPIPSDCATALQVRAGGGGGGHFIEMERDGAIAGPFVYGRVTQLFQPNCGENNPATAGNPPCSGANKTSAPQGSPPGTPTPPKLNTNTAGEDGTDGPTGLGSDHVASEAELAANSGMPMLIFDAVTGELGAKGGARSASVFTDQLPNGSLNTINDFWGTKILPNGELLRGELLTPIGGSGGGAGGDAIASLEYPPSQNHDFTGKDFRGAGGGAGGGLVWIRAVGRITANGEINADGGHGAGGEQISCIVQTGGGSGGGSGGMIVLESLTGITLRPLNEGAGTNLHCTGGDRGWGTSLNGPAAEKCSQELGCLEGGNWIGSCRFQNNPDGSGPIPAGLPARSKRNSALSMGGAGGKGLIIFAIPHNEDGSLKPGALILLNNTSISACSNPNSNYCFDTETHMLRMGSSPNSFMANPRIDPDPHITVPSFGAVSESVSRWRYLGRAKASFQFGHSDNNGRLIPAAPELMLGTGSHSQIEEPHQIRLISTSLYESIASNPNLLVGDRLRFQNSDQSYPIVGVELITGSEVGVRLATDPNAGELNATGNWTIVRRYFDVSMNGQIDSLPPHSSITVKFQGADEKDFEGSGIVDESVNSIVGPTTDMSLLQGKRFIRFFVSFDLSADGSNVDLEAPLPTLEFLKLPFQF